MTMKLLWRSSVVVGVLLWLTSASLAQSAAPLAKDDPRRFASAIETFQQEDQTGTPPKGQILFVGSSIFRLWKHLKEQMTPLPVLNRAFGGSRTADQLFYLEQVVLRYEPKVIVYYCGSNDINADIKPDQIAANFRTFTERVHAKLPRTHILYVSINRAPQKMERWDWVDDANQQIKTDCEKDKRLGFIDVNPALFDRDGKPRLELYLPDKLHFQEPAYVAFTAIIKPVLSQVWAKVK